MFHCNDEWEVLGVGGAETIEGAKASAERAYRGISAKWILTHVTEEEAVAWMRENHKDMSCSFCDRVPGDYEQLVENKAATVRVCNYCIDEHYKWIHDESKGADAG